MFTGKDQKKDNGSDKTAFVQPGRWRDAASQSLPRDDRKQGQSAPASTSVAMEAQRDLMDRVGEFMVRHELRITAANLALVCDGLSGTDARLRSALAKRELGSGRIDQAWLDSLRPCASAAHAKVQERANQMQEMMDLMENAMNNLQDNTQSAREATGAYRSAMSEHLDQPHANASGPSKSQLGANGQVSEGVARFQNLLDLSRTMLAQLKAIEAEMERNQREAEGLRQSLEKARQEADVDHLTGLPNRRAFERNLKVEVEKIKANGGTLALAFCDIDHFKLVNDVHGHSAGDRVLQAISKALSDVAGDGCFVARHGGEEFVLLFSAMDKDQAFQAIDDARLKLARRRLMNRETGQPYGQITFSAGVAQVNQFDNPRAALAAADEALYRAKEAGRNRVETA